MAQKKQIEYVNFSNLNRFFIVLYILLMLGAFAQSVQAQNLSNIGIRGGVNFANLNDTDADLDTRTGFAAGVYFNFPVSNSPVSIQPEVLYTQKGYETEDTTVKLDYIEVPVLARFDFITDGNFTPNVYFGPYVGVNVNVEVEGSSDNPTPGNFDNAIKDAQFGIVAGGGVNFGRLDLGARYSAGLTDVFDINADGKNGVFSVLAGVDI